MNHLIKMQQVSCKIGKHYLLQNITWQVKQGEQWLVFGENGSGKTTLLSAIVGYRNYTAGNLSLFDSPYDAANLLEYRKKIGWVSTSFFNKILQKESVLSIVLSGKTGTLGLSEYIDNQDILRAKQLLQVFRLAQKKDLPYKMLSKGEQQNVLLARAFFAEPEIFLLDEPNSGLDFLARMQLKRILMRMANQRQVTFVYVTHYPEEIPPIFTHCLLLKHGKIFQQGAMRDVFCSQVLSEFFSQTVEVLQEKDYFHIRLQEERV